MRVSRSHCFMSYQVGLISRSFEKGYFIFFAFPVFKSHTPSREIKSSHRDRPEGTSGIGIPHIAFPPSNRYLFPPPPKSLTKNAGNRVNLDKREKE